MCCWWTRPAATRSHTLRGHRDLVNDIRFSPDGTLVGSTSSDSKLIVWDTATGRSLERWHTFDDRGASASARTMTWSTAAAATRCCAPGTCPWRTPTCSRRPRSATPSLFGTRRPLPGRAAGGLQLGRRPGQGMGQVRRRRHRRRHASYPLSGVGGNLVFSACRRLASRRRPVRRVLVRRQADLPARRPAP